jgi:quinol monooxygenase YgiN
MIFIVVKFTVRPEHAETWLDDVAAFTAATRQEPGNLWFDWSRSVETPNQFVLIEAFADGAGEAHVASAHFQDGLATMQPRLAQTPDIINVTVPGNEWSQMGELTV